MELTVEQSELDVQIDSTSVYIARGSFSAEDKISSKGTCKFNVLDPYNNYDLDKGQPVVITDDGTHIFSGYIWTADGSKLGIEGTQYKVKCVGMAYLASKRVVAYVEKDVLAGQVVKDIVDNILTDEGVSYTASSVKDGPTLSEAAFNYVSCEQALDAIAEHAGAYWWKIDKDKVIHFKPRSEQSAPFNIESRADILEKPKTRFGNPNYRNRQYIQGRSTTDQQTAIREGDGNKNAFTVSFPIAQVPTVYVDTGAGYVEKTVGIKGLDTGKDWYWSKNDPVIAQDESGTILNSGEYIKIEYVGIWTAITIAEELEEIGRQKSLEGNTSGIVEKMEKKGGFLGSDAAEEIANSKLEKYAQKSVKFQYKTTEYGLEAGMLQMIRLSDYNIDDEMLITNVATKRNITGNDDFTYYEIEAVKGAQYSSWGDYFKELNRKVDSELRLGLSEDEIVIILKTIFSDLEIVEDFSKQDYMTIDRDIDIAEYFSKQDYLNQLENINISDNLSYDTGRLIGEEDINFTTESIDITRAAPEGRVGSAIVGYSEVGADGT